MAQNSTDSNFGKGLTAIAKGSSFSMKFDTGIQNSSDGTALAGTNGNTASFYTGLDIKKKPGYLFRKNWEIAARYTEMTLVKNTGNDNIMEYTLGMSRFIAALSFKVQNDITLHHEDSHADEYIIRLQAEQAF